MKVAKKKNKQRKLSPVKRKYNAMNTAEYEGGGGGGGTEDDGR